jgi:PAT family beta-lactamase induction signal transducer AmpG
MQGVDLVKIGFFSSAGIFWSLKPLWAPLIDKYLYKSFWISIALFGIALSIGLLSLFSPESFLFFLFLFALTFFSALLDTALDGFIIDYISKEELGKANGLRISAYRVALIFSGGILVALSEFLNFKPIFIIFSLLCLFMALLVFLNGELRIKNSSSLNLNIIEQYLAPFKELLKREKIFIIFLFVALYKIGDALLGGMVYPFWVDRGFSRLEIGFISGTLGSLFTILGSLIGGYYTGKLGLKRALLIMGFLQALSNLGYTVVAYPELDRRWVYIASIIESFTGGLGTSAFLTFLTSLCKQNFSSSQYAIFSTLFSLTLVISRTLSGLGAKALGYFTFFGVTFLIALLPLILIPLILKGDYNKLKGKEV